LQAVRSRAALVSFAATVAALAVTPQFAAADLLAPDSTASDGAGSARTLYVIMAILAALIVIVVFAAIVRALRTRSTTIEAGEDARRTRGTGSVQLRVGAGLGVLAIVLFVVGIIFTGKASEVEASANQPITIKTDAQQWLWRYEYPIKEPSEDGFSADQAYSYQELVVPVDTPITLDISSTDVLHSWSVPALAPTAEAVPGIQGEVNFTATETGTFEGRSTRFSGPGYPTMRTRVIVVEPDEYEAFVKERIDGIKQARAAVQDRVQSGTAPGVRFQTK
jgi:cytochrome c oxidase subunit II